MPIDDEERVSDSDNEDPCELPHLLRGCCRHEPLLSCEMSYLSIEEVPPSFPNEVGNFARDARVLCPLPSKSKLRIEESLSA